MKTAFLYYTLNKKKKQLKPNTTRILKLFVKSCFSFIYLFGKMNVIFF